MEVTIILVNWNQAKLSIRCVESLRQNTSEVPDLTYRIIIVDNLSQPEELGLLEQYVVAPANEGRVHLLRNSVNAGFAGGNNVGIRYALEQYAPDYIWLLNNDIIVQKEALNKLVAAANQYPKVGIWGSTIYELEPKLHFHCAGGFRYNALLSIPTPITFSGTDKLPNGLYFPLPQMDYPAGASMFIRADLFRQHGLLEEMYFLYYEELDLVRQIGGKPHLGWCPDSVLHHQSGSSTGSKNPNVGAGSRIAHYYGNLSALKYTWKHHPYYLPVVFLFRLSSKSILFLYFRDFKGFKPLVKAYIDFLKWLFSR